MVIPSGDFAPHAAAALLRSVRRLARPTYGETSMRLDKPRLSPLADEEWTDEQRELLTRGKSTRVINIFRTLVRHPALYKSWMPFGSYLFKSTLDAREREILILRVGVLCDAGYEFHQHVAIGKRVGLTDAEIEQIRRGPSAAEWAPFDRVLVQATDELVQDKFISDRTWAALREKYDEKQILDLIFTVGQYTLVSMALNSLGVQIERETSESEARK
jgi:alkylhydroperoxidase family enzyme